MAYTECEKRAYLDAREFFKRNPKIYTHYFPTSDDKYCRHDTYAVNYTGGTELVELKKRNATADTYDDAFIEIGKYDYLMKHWEESGLAPIYINFIGDWHNTYVWYLNEITGFTKDYHQVSIRNQDGTYKKEDRHGLAWDSAWHYRYDDEGNLIERTAPRTKIETERKAAQSVDDIDLIEEIRIRNEKKLGL